ncbi:efflux RND transporter periplasmic adaptor subunit [Francisella sp. LA112445]|uniref:efflux RND transporter periplasmic adaptor subunit n=1 Tax=Francisella sp. LA112445 TaxID=1395624 RepID=UPI0018A484AA|nr:efflux RND transporter periplasmic adaptor subunit [Francisella sp. LA112445]QIW09551.1 efflux RND transporter periplasmic adaptor subunit [Francisella sp. LA112445]
MINYKKYIKIFKEKIQTNKKIYSIFVIIILILVWSILGDIGLIIGVIYLILRLPIIKKQIAKLRNRKIFSIFVIVVTFLIFGLIFGSAELMQTLTNYRMAKFRPEPDSVTSTKIKETGWKRSIDTIGEVQAVQTTQISTQSGGIISKINFVSGQEVKKGDLLFELDTSQLKADLEEALSNLKLARVTYERYKSLAKERATSKESADKAAASYLSALAKVKNIESQIGFKEVRAPFDGKIGIRNISLGQYFNNGDNAATLAKINPVFINFAVPQNKLSLIHLGQSISFYSDSYKGQKFSAKITAINSFINNSNRSIIVQATYKNPEHKILPGMFLNIHINLQNEKDAVVIPRNAINYSLYGQSVLTLTQELDSLGKPKKAIYTSTEVDGMKTVRTNKNLYKVGEVNIKVLETRNNLALVSGLKPNTMIVTSGQNKVHKGMDVMLNNTIKLDNNIYTQGDDI